MMGHTETGQNFDIFFVIEALKFVMCKHLVQVSHRHWLHGSLIFSSHHHLLLISKSKTSFYAKHYCIVPRLQNHMLSVKQYTT